MLGDILHILDCLGQVNAGYLQVLFLGRAPCTKETLPDFLKWRRVTRPPLVFRGLTGSQRTPGFWGVTISFSPSMLYKNPLKIIELYLLYIYSISEQLSFDQMSLLKHERRYNHKLITN